MAALSVTIKGVLYDGMGPVSPYEVGKEVTIVGIAYRTDVGVGGGPIIPPPSGGGGSPEHPIVIPDPPLVPPDIPAPVPPLTVLKEAPPGGGWSLCSDSNSSIYWSWVPMGQAVPKR
jgi:hypothetical protein